MIGKLSPQQREIASFAIVGVVGFGSDALSFLLFFHWLDFGHYVSRLFAFILAVTVTWLLNRTFTFQVEDSSQLHREYVTYFASQSVGALVNFGVFAACITFSPTMERYPVIALVIGSGIAMVINFIAMKWVVFKSNSPSGKASGG